MPANVNLAKYERAFNRLRVIDKFDLAVRAVEENLPCEYYEQQPRHRNSCLGPACAEIDLIRQAGGWKRDGVEHIYDMITRICQVRRQFAGLIGEVTPRQFTDWLCEIERGLERAAVKDGGKDWRDKAALYGVAYATASNGAEHGDIGVDWRAVDKRTRVLIAEMLAERETAAAPRELAVA